MSDLARFVEHSDRLTDVFGAWPSFHDAEVVAIDLWRGDIPKRDSWIGAVLTAKIQVLEATQPGATHSGNDTLVTLRFHDIDRVHLHGFNHQNAILGLSSSTSSVATICPPTSGFIFSRRLASMLPLSVFASKLSVPNHTLMQRAASNKSLEATAGRFTKSVES